MLRNPGRLGSMTEALLEEVEKNKPEARAGEAFEAGRWREANGRHLSHSQTRTTNLL